MNIRTILPDNTDYLIHTILGQRHGNYLIQIICLLIIRATWWFTKYTRFL